MAAGGRGPARAGPDRRLGARGRAGPPETGASSINARRATDRLLALGVTLAAALGLAAAPGPGEPPEAGVLEPGRSLGGLGLGATEAEVRRAWGNRFGRCRNCREQTWYFNARPFAPEGAGVEFRRGRAASLFTLWSPEGWRTPEGLAIGDHVGRVTEVYGAMTRRECGGYYALVRPRGRTVTAYYVVGERVWAFGLNEAAIPVCRR